MINEEQPKSGSVKVRLPNFGLLIECANGAHPHAAHQMARQFQEGFGDVFHKHLANLNQHRTPDVNLDVFVEEAIKREIENLARQVVHANHLLFSVESHHRLPFSFIKQIGQSVYLVSTGAHQVLGIQSQDGTIFDLNATAHGLTNDPISDIKRKEEAMKTGDVSVRCLHADPKDRIILLGEDAARHMTIDVLQDLIQQTKSSDALEQEMELYANVARRESQSDSLQEMMVLVMEVN